MICVRHFKHENFKIVAVIVPLQKTRLFYTITYGRALTMARLENFKVRESEFFARLF